MWWAWLRGPTQNPKKVVPIGFLGFQANRASCAFPRDVRPDLDVDELGTRDVAAQDVGIGCIAERDHGVIAPAAQFSEFIDAII